MTPGGAPADDPSAVERRRGKNANVESVDDGASAELALSLDEIVRAGARRMLAAALEAEVDAYVSSFVDEVDGDGKRLVVRNGHAEARSIATGAGPIEIRSPRVNGRRVDEVSGERHRFRSAIVPPWARKSPKVAEVFPLMYLHGMSSGDFVPALEEFFGSAAGLSASVMTRLTAQWQDERDRFSKQDLGSVDYVYVWADRVHFNVRLDDSRLCALVIVGADHKVTKGGSKAAGLAMAFKLIEAAQERWRAVNAPHLVALVRAGAKFEKGVLVERQTGQKTQVAA